MRKFGNDLENINFRLPDKKIPVLSRPRFDLAVFVRLFLDSTVAFGIGRIVRYISRLLEKKLVKD
jgi:hypothetical protein